MIPIRDTIPSRSVPVVTWALIAVNALIFFYEVSLDPIELERFVYLFGLVPARYSHPEWLPDADSYAATARSRGSSANANTSSMELTGWKRSA